MILNSYVLYKLNKDKPQPRVKYYISVIESLAEEWLAEKTPAYENGDGGGPSKKLHGVERIEGGKEKRCCECSGKKNADGKRKRSRTVCVRCGRGLHMNCLPSHKCKLL
ncbi:hypothetical protein J6590_108135 [Homalodisca vitripennis]|nr:hypothetical protein J6590_108135 [Homalodisca vitripennis]